MCTWGQQNRCILFYFDGAYFFPFWKGWNISVLKNCSTVTLSTKKNLKKVKNSATYYT